MNFDPTRDDPDKLTGFEKKLADVIVLGLAMDNSYLIITEQVTYEALVSEHLKLGRNLYTAHKVEEDIDNDLLNVMIKHFESLEEYEKCAVLFKMLDK